MCRATPGLTFFRLRIQHYISLCCSTSWLTCLPARVVTCNTYLWRRFPPWSSRVTGALSTIVYSILSIWEVMALLIGCLHRREVWLASSRSCLVKCNWTDWGDFGIPVTTGLIRPADVPMRPKTVKHTESAWVCHNVKLLQFCLILYFSWNPMDYVTLIVSRPLSSERKTEVLGKTRDFVWATLSQSVSRRIGDIFVHHPSSFWERSRLAVWKNIRVEIFAPYRLCFSPWSFPPWPGERHTEHSPSVESTKRQLHSSFSHLANTTHLL